MVEQSSDSLLHDIQSVISELVRTLKLYWFYSEDHPAAQQLIRTLSTKISNLVEEGPITLNLTKEDIYLGAVPLDKKNKNNIDFIRHCNKRRIYSITFQQGIQDEGIMAMVRILAMDPKQIRRQGGIRKQLHDAKVTHIEISEYLYDQLVTDGVDGPPEGDDEFMVTLSPDNVHKFQSYLKGDIEELPPEDEDMFVDLMQNPMRVSELMNQAIPAMEKINNTQISDSLRQFNQRIHKVISKRPKEQKRLLMRKVATSFLHQRPETSLDVLTKSPSLTSEQMNSIQEIVDNMSDDEILDLIVKTVSGQDDPEDIKPVITNLPVDSTRGLRITQKYTHLLDQRRKNDLDIIELNKIKESFDSYNRPLVLKDTMGMMMELFENERQSTVHQDIFSTLEKILLELVILRQYDTCLDIISVLQDSIHDNKKYSDEIKKVVLDNHNKLISQEVVDKLISSFANATGQEEDQIISILSFMTAHSKRIVEVFSNNPNIILRRPLSRVLVKMGDSAVAEIIQQIPQCSEDVARELISILGQIGTTKAMDHLKSSFPNVHPVLQQNIAMTLGEYQTDETRDWIIKQLHQVKDTQVQLAFLEGLGKKGDQASISTLKVYAFKFFMKDDNERPLQHKAIQLLGRLNVTEVIPDLIRIFRSSRWIPSKKRDQLRIIVAQTLWKMNDLNAKQTVRDGCRDFRRSVRHMCKSLVMTSSIDSGKEGL